MSEGKFFYHRQHVHHTHEVPHHHEHPELHPPKPVKPYELENIKAAIHRAAPHWKHGSRPTHHLKGLDTRHYHPIHHHPATALSSREAEIIQDKKKAYARGNQENPPKTNRELLEVIQRGKLRADLPENRRILKDKQIVAFNELVQRSKNPSNNLNPAILEAARATIISKANQDPTFSERYNKINGFGSYQRDVLRQVPPTGIIPPPPRTLG